MLKNLRVLVPGAYFISIVTLWGRLMSPYLFSSPLPPSTLLAGLTAISSLLISLSTGWKSLQDLRFRRLFIASNVVISLGVIRILVFRNDGPIALYLPIILLLFGGAIVSTTAFMKRSK